MNTSKRIVELKARVKELTAIVNTPISDRMVYVMELARIKTTLSKAEYKATDGFNPDSYFEKIEPATRHCSECSRAMTEDDKYLDVCTECFIRG